MVRHGGAPAVLELLCRSTKEDQPVSTLLELNPLVSKDNVTVRSPTPPLSTAHCCLTSFFFCFFGGVFFWVFWVSGHEQWYPGMQTFFLYFMQTASAEASPLF